MNQTVNVFKNLIAFSHICIYIQCRKEGKERELYSKMPSTPEQRAKWLTVTKK